MHLIVYSNGQFALITKIKYLKNSRQTSKLINEESILKSAAVWIIEVTYDKIL